MTPRRPDSDLFFILFSSFPAICALSTLVLVAYAVLPVYAVDPKSEKSLSDGKSVFGVASVGTGDDERFQNLLGATAAVTMNQLNEEAKRHPSAPAYVRLGAAYLNVGDIETAQVVFKKALQLEPKSAVAHIGMSRVYASQSKWPLVFAELGEATKNGDENTSANALWESAFIHRELREYDIAIKQFTEVLKTKSLPRRHRGLILDHRGETYFRMGKVDEGIADLQESIKLNPNFMYSHIALGQLLACKDRNDDAIKQFSFVIDTEKSAAANEVLGGVTTHLLLCYKERAALYKKIGRIDLFNKDIRAKQAFERGLLKDMPFRSD